MLFLNKFKNMFSYILVLLEIILKFKVIEIKI